MASVEKLLQKMKTQPNNIRPEEAEKVLEASGYRADRHKGSHKHYINNKGDVITIVQKNPLKEYQVKQILERIGEWIKT